MLDNPNGHPEEEAMEPEPLPLRTKGPPTSQDQQQQPPTSPPKATEDELDAALNGQEPTVKNLILAAIGVMKNRKARPDSKRISNWINRRYGRSLNEVEQELERLVGVGELARVDYKGSASFRIVQPDAKTKRRRRSQKPTAQPTPSRPPSLSLFSTPNAAAGASPESLTHHSPLLASQAGNNGTGPPLTLRTLVIEMWGDSASASIDSGVTVNAQFIARAVEASHRNIYQAAVLGNLDLILAKEVESGNFIKVGEDQYRVSPYGGSSMPFQHHHSLLALNPPLAHPPPAPVPVQQLMLESRGPGSNGLDQQPPPSFSPSASSPAIMPPPPPPPPAPPSASGTQPPTTNSPTNSHCPLTALGLPSDEQRKNDLIAAKLSKMEGKSKSPGKKTWSFGGFDKNRHKVAVSPGAGGVGSNGHVDIKKEPGLLASEDCEDLPLTVARSVINNAAAPASLWGLEEEAAANPTGMVVSEPKSKATKKRRLDPSAVLHHIKVEPTNSALTTGITDRDLEAVSASSRSGTGRKKKSRKIFDPADHEQPVRKRKAPSPVAGSSGEDTVSRPQSSSGNALLKPRGGGCIYCGLSSQKQRKGGRLEPLIRCKDCPTTVHPTCMDYSEKLIKKIFQSASWQCTNCKTCHVCQEANDDDCMLFCDSCDLGYHMVCHSPPLVEKPNGKWECSLCASSLQSTTPPTLPPPPPPSALAMPAKATLEPNPIFRAGELEENTRFVPILPPHLHPHTGLLPENWEDYDVDPHIPDVTEWEPGQLRDFFSQKGFSDSTTDIFLQQEIDGRSLLLMHRTDVISSLGLKLGPALKLFSCIKKLQTRRNFPDY